MDKLSLDTLAQKGAFTGQPVKKELTWYKGDEELVFTVYIRRLSYHSAVSDVESLATGDGNVAARRIAYSVVDEHGDPIFKVSDITGYHEDGSPVMVEDPESGEMVERGGLDDELVTSLLVLIGEVNDMGKTRPPKPTI